jgi:hypothetical protein
VIVADVVQWVEEEIKVLLFAEESLDLKTLLMLNLVRIPFGATIAESRLHLDSGPTESLLSLKKNRSLG